MNVETERFTNETLTTKHLPDWHKVSMENSKSAFTLISIDDYD